MYVPNVVEAPEVQRSLCSNQQENVLRQQTAIIPGTRRPEMVLKLNMCAQNAVEALEVQRSPCCSQQENAPRQRTETIPGTKKVSFI